MTDHRTGRSTPAALAVLAVLAGLAGQMTAAADAHAKARTRTIVDMVGRVVEIPSRVTRVATNYPALPATMLLLGQADKVVATPGGYGASLFPTVYPRISRIPAPFTGGTAQVNMEELLKTRPQVAFVSESTQAIIPTLRKAGIPVVVFSVFNTSAQIKAGVRLAARVLGGRAVSRARQYGRYVDGIADRVRRKASKITRAGRPPAYYAAANPLQTEGQSSIVTSWMSLAGGRNVAAENGVTAPPVFATVNVEDLLHWNPTVIICRDTPVRAQILADKRLRTLAAVRRHRVFVNPEGVFVWSVRSAESALQPLWAAKIFHPRVFRDVDIRKEVRTFYARFYGYRLSKRQVETILDPPR